MWLYNALRLARLKMRYSRAIKEWLRPVPTQKQEVMTMVRVVRPARGRRPLRNTLAQQAAELAWAQQLLRSAYR